MPAASLDPARPADGMVLLSHVYAHFRETGKWPLAWKVELELEDTLEPSGGLVRVCDALGNDLIVCGSLHHTGSDVKLRLDALEVLPEARDDLQAFLALGRYAADRYRNSVEQPVSISVSEFVRDTGVPEPVARRAFIMGLQDGHFTSGGSSEQFSLNNFAPKLLKLSSLHEHNALWAKFMAQATPKRDSFVPSAAPLPLASATKKIFLSHAADDYHLAAYIARALRAADASLVVFVASVPGQIETGTEWLARIKEELRNADTYLVLLTTRSVERPWIWFETGAAWFSERRLIPLVTPDLSKHKVPMPLAAHQILSLDLERDVEQLFLDLGISAPRIDQFVAHIRSLELRGGETG